MVMAAFKKDATESQSNWRKKQAKILLVILLKIKTKIKDDKDDVNNNNQENR